MSRRSSFPVPHCKGIDCMLIDPKVSCRISSPGPIYNGSAVKTNYGLFVVLQQPEE